MVACFSVTSNVQFDLQLIKIQLLIYIYIHTHIYGGLFILEINGHKIDTNSELKNIE